MDDGARLEKKKRRSPVKAPVIGWKIVNKYVCNAIGKVLTKARQRDKIAAKRRADPEKYASINQAAQAKFYKDHKTKVLQWNKEQREKKHAAYLERTRKQRKQRRLTDKEFVIKDRLRSRLSSALKRQKASKPSDTFSLVGCASTDLWKHISLKPAEVIDHIFPFELYDLHDGEQVGRVMHYSNLQPLTEPENRDKGTQLPTKAMAAKVDPSCWPDGITMDMLPDIYPGWSTALRM